MENKEEISLFCARHNLTIEQFYGKEIYVGSIVLKDITDFPIGFNPKVTGDLDLRNVINIPDNFCPVVGEKLKLGSVESIGKGFKAIVGGTLFLGIKKSLPIDFNPILIGNLIFNNLESIENDFNLTIGENLFFNNLKFISGKFTPIVGTSLHLSNLDYLTINSLFEASIFNPKIRYSMHPKTPYGVLEDGTNIYPPPDYFVIREKLWRSFNIPEDQPLIFEQSDFIIKIKNKYYITFENNV